MICVWLITTKECRQSDPINNQPSLQWHHNQHDSVTNHRRLDCLLNRLFRRGSKKISTLRVDGIVRRIHLSPLDSPYKSPVTRKLFPFDDVIIVLFSLRPDHSMDDINHSVSKGRLCKIATHDCIYLLQIIIWYRFGPKIWYLVQILSILYRP